MRASLHAGVVLLAAATRQATSAPPPTVFRWSYAPSFDTFRFVILHPPAEATHWSLALSEISSSSCEEFYLCRAINATAGTLPTKKVGESWVVQKLGAGRYKVRFELTKPGMSDADDDAGGAIVLAHEERFNRTIRPFEKRRGSGGRRLGLDQAIVPPFSANDTTAFSHNNLTAGRAIADGDRLGFMGGHNMPNSRAYMLGAGGLPKQIVVVPPETPRDNCTCCIGAACDERPGNNPPCGKSLCKQDVNGEYVCKKPACPGSMELLAAPMSFVATIVGANGGTVEHPSNSTGGASIGTITTADSNVAKIEADFGWTAGPLSGKTSAVVDYDGCMKFTVELSPTTVPLRSLQRPSVASPCFPTTTRTGSQRTRRTS
eukprot:SAG22_NODE_1_length_62449_cov_158.689270_28_plen_375_part_00